MESTHSATLRNPAKGWGYQFPLTGQESQFVVTDVGNMRYQGNRNVFPDNMWSIGSTSYGGVRLKPNSSSSVVLIVYLQEDQINKVLLYPNLNEATISKPISDSLRSSVPLLPLLDDICWTETAPTFSYQWLYSAQPSVLARRPLTEQEFMELQYHEGKISNFPHPEPLTQEEQVERERLGMLFASDKPLSELIIEDRGPY